jgi:hypothetical protein
MHIDLGGDRGVGLAVGGGQDDLGADHIAVSGPGRMRPDHQLLMFLGGQDDHKRGRDDHGLVVSRFTLTAAAPRRGGGDR